LAVEKLLEERHAPTATGARAVAKRQLAGDARPLDADEAEELAPCDVEAVTYLGVVVHRPLLLQRSRSPRKDEPPPPMSTPSTSTDGPLDPTLVPPAPAAPPKALVPQSATGPGFEEETRVLLHRRLLACHVIIALMCLALVLVSLVDNRAFHGASPSVGYAVNAFMLLCSAAGALWLRRNPGLSMGALRATELVCFGTGLALLGVV